MLERNRIRVALIFFACASVASVSTLVGQGLFASDTSSAGVQPTNSAEATAAAAENSLMAMYSPLPLNHSQVATPCPSGDCASAPLVRSFSNVPSPLSQAASDWSRASISKRINARRMIRRNDEVLNSLFATDISEKQSIYARAVANSEQEYADGQTSGCGDCTITIAAGAEILSFDAEKISNDSATISSSVRQWNQMGRISSSGSIGNFFTASNVIHVIDILERDSSGNWHVVQRSESMEANESP